MQGTFSLIQCLTSAEYESLTRYLSCFSSHDVAEIKTMQLAKLLREAEECPSDKLTCRKLYGKLEDLSFEKLKSRLREKTLDFLLTDISSDKKQELDEMDYAIIRINKKAAQFQQLYYSKRRLPLLYNLLDDIINEAKIYERYSILIEYLRHKKNLVSFKQGKKEFEKTNTDMQHVTKCNELYNKAEHYYHEIIMMSDYDGRQEEKKKIEWLKKTIVEITEENKKIKSPHVNYSVKALELEYYQIKKDYAKARSICMEWLNIVRENKSVYRRQRVGIVYDHLSRCEYYLGHFKHAADWAREAQTHFNLNSENFCIALEQEFYALFALKEFTKAEETANKMIASATRKELGEFRYAKYNFLLTNTLFELRRFTEALNILSQEMEISKDKTGWEIGLRTLKIMTLVEMQKHNEAELAVLALREFIKYTDKKAKENAPEGEKETAGISQRDRMIFNLLMQAERKGFAFEHLLSNLKEKNKLEKNIALLTGSGALQWEPFTHEVIPFHEWFEQKLGKRKTPAPALKKEKKEKAKVTSSK